MSGFESMLERELVAAAGRRARRACAWKPRLVGAAAAAAAAAVLVLVLLAMGGDGGERTREARTPPAPAPEVVARGVAPEGEWQLKAIACPGGRVELSVGGGSPCSKKPRRGRELTIADERELGTTFVYGTTSERVESVRLRARRRSVRVPTRSATVRGREVRFYVTQVRAPVATATAFARGRPVDCVPASRCAGEPPVPRGTDGGRAGNGREGGGSGGSNGGGASGGGSGGSGGSDGSGGSGGGSGSNRELRPRRKDSATPEFVRAHPASTKALLAGDASGRNPWSLTVYGCGGLAPGDLIVNPNDGPYTIGRTCRWQRSGAPPPLTAAYAYLRGAQRTLIYGAAVPGVERVRAEVDGRSRSIPTQRPTAAMLSGTGLRNNFVWFVLALPANHRVTAIGAPGVACERAPHDRTDRDRDRATAPGNDPERRYSCARR